MALLKDHHPAGLKESDTFAETYFLACMLHDIGTIPKNQTSTRLSFELWGAIRALQLLADFGAQHDQAELVAEVINRHQDLGETGSVPAVLALLYFSTLFGE